MRRNYKIVGQYKIWFGASFLIMAIGLAFVLARGFNIGIDFSGGTMMQFQMGKVVEVSQVTEAVKEHKLNPEVLHAGQDKTDVIIRTKVDLDSKERKVVFESMQKKFGLKDGAMISQAQFGPAIGKEIQNKAIYGILAACFFMLIYIAFRFEINFGISAVLALVHDILILLSVYAIFYIPIDTSFIAAVLTVVGYSINDTIVVFDRIRENIQFNTQKNKSYEDLADTSINETLSRSINTSLTTLIVITVMYVLGVDSIKDFSFPLVIGIAAGTFSSIFIASPIWVLLKTRAKEKAKAA